MPIAFRSIAGNSIAGSTAGNQTLTINKPAGTVDGDVMLVVVAQAAAGVFTPPAGWTSLGTSSSYGQADVLYKVASGEGASYAFTVAGGDPHAAVGLIASYSTVELSPSPIDATANQTNASSTSATAPSVTPSATTDMLVCLFSSDSSSNTSVTTSTPPAGMTERGDSGTTYTSSDGYTVAYVQASINDVLLASSSPTGAKVATLSAANANSGFSVLLRPVGAPPPPPPAGAVGLHMVI